MRSAGALPGGANVSPAFLVDAVRLRQPNVVLLTVTLEAHRPALQATLDALHRADVSARVIIGGQGSVGEDALAMSMHAPFEELARHLIAAPPTS